MRNGGWKVLGGVGAIVAVGLLFGAAAKDSSIFGQTVAAWAQATGSVAAIVGAIWIASQQSREAAARELQAQQVYLHAVIALAEHAEHLISSVAEHWDEGRRLSTKSEVRRLANPEWFRLADEALKAVQLERAPTPMTVHGILGIRNALAMSLEIIEGKLAQSGDVVLLSLPNEAELALDALKLLREEAERLV